MKETKKIDFKNLIKKLSKPKMLIIIIAIILLVSFICVATTQVIKTIRIKNLESKPLLEYEIKERNDEEFRILVKINSTEGIETIKYVDSKNGKPVELECRNKMVVGIDYLAKDREDYEFKIKLQGKSETTETLHFEIPRIHGNYTLSHGIYVYEPKLDGYNENFTRYLNIDSNNNLKPGNWISGTPPSNWYNYAERQWANIYVENNGLETYYVWIPRYCFKLDQENERSDIKFINVYNEYKDSSGNITTWEQLKEQGYQIPEAFMFNDLDIPGYWANKYTLGERNAYTINFDAIASKTKVAARGISTNTTTTIAKYTYSLNGQILKESTTSQDFTYATNTEGSNYLNVTALDANGEIVGSMTKECTQAIVNEPDLSGFDVNTTFYVTYDENQNEHSTIPISENAPDDWYDYADSQWANIVTRNNELEAYYTWIPRYEFKLDQTAQRSSINFKEGTDTQVTEGYQIPEAFTFNGKQLTGYWATKYTLGAEIAPIFDTEVMATSSSITTKGVTGTSVATGQVYKYYINGEYKGQNTSSTAKFEFSNLSSDTEYTILVEIRNNTTDAYLGTIVKQIKTIDANKPDLTGFNTKETDSNGNKLPVTYYVLYDDSGNEKVGDKIKNDGSNMPSNWYNYSKSIWANIVVTDGTIVNGNITNATKTTYYTWIPRYEFMITSSQYQQTATARTEVRFLQGTSTQTDVGYQIPEAFTFNGKQLTGYWSTKYTLGE